MAQVNKDDPLFAIQAVMSEADWERVQADEVASMRYIRSARHEAVSGRLTRLIHRAVSRHDAKSEFSRENRLPGRVQLVVGGAGAGKTTAIERAILEHPALRPIDGTNPKRPVLSINAPEIPSAMSLYTRLLAATGYPVLSRLPAEAALQRFKAQARQLGVVIVHIDDGANAIVGQDAFRRRRAAERITACLRGFLEDENPISLVISGLPATMELYHCDEAFARRSEVLNISPIQREEMPELAKRIRKHAVDAELDFDPTEELIERLVHAARGQFGLAFEISWQAIAQAKNRSLTGSTRRLEQRDFAQVYFQRTACSFGRNVFEAPDWNAIDTLKPVLLPDDEPQRKPHKARK